MSLNKNPRLIAVHILTSVLLNNQSLKEEFEGKTKSLIKRDIAFVKNLVYGILRFKKSIDRVVREFYKGRYSKLKEKQKSAPSPPRKLKTQY